MKKLFLFMFLLSSVLGYSQAASKVNNGQNTYATGQPRVILSCDTLPSGLFRLYPKAQLTWNWSQIQLRPTNLAGYGITDAVPVNRTINGYNLSTDITLSSSDVGAYPATGNPSGFLTSAPVTSVFGRSGAVVAQNGDYNTDQIPEGSRLYLTNTRVRSAISGGTGINYNSTTGAIVNSAPDQTVTLTAGNRISITGTYPNFTISYVEPTINIVSRTLNSNFTPSTTKQAVVTYTVTCSVTNPLLVGTSSATAFLEYSTNGGSSWVLPAQNGNSSGVGITVTLQLTNGQTGTLIGVIPANALVRIRTATSGTASVTYVTGQETY